MFLKEMAKPSQQLLDTNWYHGCDRESMLQIKKAGFLRPKEIVTNGMMAPMGNKVYLTSDLTKGIGYALFRSGSSLKYPRQNEDKNIKGYLIVVKGSDLQDVDPDEDSIADMVPEYLRDEETGVHPFSWLRSLAKYHAPKSLQRYDNGDYAHGTKLGKMLVKYLSDLDKLKIINHHKNVAHTGKIPIDQIWEIPAKYQKELLADINTYQNYCKRIK